MFITHFNVFVNILFKYVSWQLSNIGSKNGVATILKAILQLFFVNTNIYFAFKWVKL